MPPFTKSQRRLHERMITFERRVFMSLNFENTFLESPPPNAKRKTIKPKCGTYMDFRTTEPESLDIRLIENLFTRLPRELRDQIYTHIIGHRRTIYIVAEDLRLFRYDPHQPIEPFNLLPTHLLPRPPKPPPASANPPLPPTPTLNALLTRLTTELATTFLATNTFALRYRFTPAPLSFLTTPFADTSVLPIQHTRRLILILSEPECPDEEYDDDLPDVEFSWDELLGTTDTDSEASAQADGGVVPEMRPGASGRLARKNARMRNAKCSMFRAQLERDMGALAEGLNGAGRGVEEVVVLPTAVGVGRAPLWGWARRWGDRVVGKRVRVSALRDGDGDGGGEEVGGLAGG